MTLELIGHLKEKYWVKPRRHHYAIISNEISWNAYTHFAFKSNAFKKYILCITKHTQINRVEKTITDLFW